MNHQGDIHFLNLTALLDEHHAIAAKVEALYQFTLCSDFASVDSTEQNRILHQLDLMRRYMTVVFERIEARRPVGWP